MITTPHTSDSNHPLDPNKELTGLDKMIDVIAILVLKFGRATTALIVVGGLLILCLTVLVITMIQALVTRNEVRDLLDRQELLIKSQARLEKTMTTTQLVLTSTLEKVMETQAKVENVAESTPKIKVDEKTGKTKLVLQKPEQQAAPRKGIEFSITPD